MTSTNDEKRRLSVAVTDGQQGFGSTVPSGSMKVDATSKQQITAKPQSGYLLDFWEDNGHNVGNANPLVLEMANSYHTIYAHFIQSKNQEIPLKRETESITGEDSPIADLFEELRTLLNDEKDEILSKVDEQTPRYRAKVLSFTDGAATIRCEKANQLDRQEEVIIYREDKTVINACTVFETSENVISLTLPEDASLNDNEKIMLSRTDLLIAIELQLGLLDQIKNGEINSAEPPLNFFIGTHSLPDLKPTITLSETERIANNIRLDDSQVTAVEKALSLNEGELMLIIGPPGTGKTRVIRQIAEKLKDRGEKVLISSHTNIAVDNAIEGLPLDAALRIGKPEKVLAKDYLLNNRVKEASEEFRKLERNIRVLRTKYRNLQKLGAVGQMSFSDSHFKGSMSEIIGQIREYENKRDKLLKNNQRKLVEESPIIGSTLIRTQLPPLEEVKFDTVIIDEASQASISLALLAMVKAKKWILVGDHKQLLPIFKNSEEIDVKRLCVFTHLLGKYENRATWLNWTYRSNNKIMDFLSKYVYDDKIKSAPDCDKIKLKIDRLPNGKGSEILDPEKPVVFVDVMGETCSDGESKYNNLEVDACCEIVAQLASAGVSMDRIGVITPYRAQRSLLASRIHDLEIKTVDSFQGREKDVIVVVLTATEILKSKALQNPNKLNVAFSRPKSKLIVIGNAQSIMDEYRNIVHEQKKVRNTRLAHLFLKYAADNGWLYSWSKKKWRSCNIP